MNERDDGLQAAEIQNHAPVLNSFRYWFNYSYA